MRLPTRVLLSALAVSLTLAASPTVLDHAHAAAPATTAIAMPGVAATPAVDQPNIVFVLTDDWSTELIQYMNQLQDMAAHGVTFDNYMTASALCCPSRASILTGKYPHNTGVLNNQWPDGGMTGFLAGDNEVDSVAAYLDPTYRTGLMGKYLNGYRPLGDGDEDAGEPEYPGKYVPPGWDEWFATGAAYQEFHYNLVESIDGVRERVVYNGGAESNYFTDVLADRAADFIDRNADQPFFLMVDPFATHGNAGSEPDPDGPESPRFPPAPRDRGDSATRPASWAPPEFPAGGDCGAPDGGCDSAPYPDPTWGASFNKPPKHAPDWYGTKPKPVSQHKLDAMKGDHLDRIRMSQSIDDLLGTIRAAVDAAGVSDRTYIMFATDNGYHLGQHALGQGKSTAYDSDIRSPLVVLPPGGLDAPVTVSRLVQNVDYVPTFLQLAGLAPAARADGQSFAWAIDGQSEQPAERAGALSEFNGISQGLTFKQEPDIEPKSLTPPKYYAIRALDYLYVDYSVLDSRVPKKGEAEFYDLTVDPDETNNVFRDLPKDQRTALNTALNAYASCSGATCLPGGLVLPDPLPLG